jgi:hypothetical protein
MKDAMKTTLIVLVTFATIGIGSSLCAQDKGAKKPTQKEASVWMQMKLGLTQGILKGLTESDFDKIAGNAAAMNILDYFEAWSRSDIPEYKRQLSYFDFANRELGRQAAAKNIEGATLAYNQLTVSCVTCHKIVRDANAKK